MRNGGCRAGGAAAKRDICHYVNNTSAETGNEDPEIM